MSFVASYYSYKFEITHAGNAHEFRLKIPRHPSESDEYFVARIIALLHCYTPGLSYVNPDVLDAEPTICKKDTVGNILHWVEVGCPSERKIRHSIRHAKHDHLPTQFSVYFYLESQVLEFCHHLRGSRSNWVSEINFYLIDSQFLQALIPHMDSGAAFRVTIVDEVMYLQLNSFDYTTEFQSLDIWAEFQKSIKN